MSQANKTNGNSVRQGVPDIKPGLVMQRDLRWLQRKHHQLASFRGAKDKKSGLLERLQRRTDQSMQQVKLREQLKPRLDFDPELPISRWHDEIVEAIQQHPVVIVAGETGSGKSTQLPKMAIQAGGGRRGLIGCTQPRRIAARSVARRVAEEMQTALGELVGFQVRFNEKVSENSLVKFMTDGILLNEIHSDRQLDRYDTLIIDEAHERSLNIDFLLGYLKQLLNQRPDLRIIITSATIDTERFAEHFNDAPVIQVEGRGYPVSIEYLPPNDGEELPRTIKRALDRVSRIDARGDVLVFLPGEREIFQAAKYLNKAGLPHTEVLPLYARLPAASQDRIFQPHTGRRVVLATNVAETSLTVPGIRFVIDSGLARISRYATHSKVLRLPVEPVSQAACNQRAGRCGRIGPGTCVRLFDEEDFERRPEFTEPEIQRTSLVGVVLEMLSLKLGDPEQFPFLDEPPKKLLNEAWNTLTELQAIEDNHTLTALGRQMARMPVDARQARILIEAQQRNALADVLVVVAGLSVADPRERPLDQQQAADQAHAAFQVPGSDFLSLLKLWHWWQQVRKDHSRNQATKQARSHFLSPNRLYEWGQLHGQLRQLARDHRWELHASQPLDGASEDDESKTSWQARADRVHRSLLSGLLAQVGQHQFEGHGKGDGRGDGRGDYAGARGHKFRIFPGSVLAKSTPNWIMAAELVETSRPFARMVAGIQPQWLEQQAAHLIRSRVFDPHWDRRSGRVMGFQQVSLFGLILVEKRKVHFGPHAPEEARALFIRHALVRGEMNHRAEFLKRNQRLQQELAQHEHKRRQRDVLADEGQLLAFFNERLPGSIFTVKAFARWYEGLDNQAQQQLLYDRATLLRENAPTSGDEFPDRLEFDGERYKLHYRFEPGHDADGVTLICPLHRLNRLDADALEWLVPGLLNDKIRALLGTLPKSKRRAFVPAADYAQAALEALGEPQGSLRATLAEQLSRIGGLDIEPNDFQTERLPEHLIMNLRVIGEGGKVLTESRDLEQLQSTLGQQARKEFMQRQADEWLQDGLKTLDLTLPEVVKTRTGHSAWPALIDQEHAVGLRLFDDEDEAHLSHQYGVHRLLLIALADKLRYVAKQHRLSSAAALAWTRVGDVQALERKLHERVVFDAIEDSWTIRSPDALSQLEQAVRPRLIKECQHAIELLDQTLIRWHAVRGQLSEIGPAQPSAQEDIESQLDDLLYPDFTADISTMRLAEYPRYLDGIDQRLQALEIDPRRDVRRQTEVEPWWQRYLDYIHSGQPYSAELNHYRWLIEEFRIQVFAQQLGTREKVSIQRLEQAWQTVVA